MGIAIAVPILWCDFTYDAAGQPLTMTLDGTVYYYLLNIQGDVMGLVDGSGNLMAAFSYTAYGKAYSVNNVSSMGTTLASANPLTYRGYVLDMGTGIYYLQSRYYDPNIGRFLNADAFASTGQGILGNNMFTYCLNNPVMYSDPTGTIAAFDDIAILILIAVIFVVACVFFSPPVQKFHYNMFCDTIEIFNSLVIDTVSLLQAKKKSESLPKKGEPNTDAELTDDKTGEVKQRRHYGEDGNAEYDIDYKHSNGDGSHKFPHTHYWKDGVRLPTSPSNSGFHTSALTGGALWVTMRMA